MQLCWGAAFERTKERVLLGLTEMMIQLEIIQIVLPDFTSLPVFSIFDSMVSYGRVV